MGELVAGSVKVSGKGVYTDERDSRHRSDPMKSDGRTKMAVFEFRCGAIDAAAGNRQTLIESSEDD